jgi:hypothetical protein
LERSASVCFPFHFELRLSLDHASFFKAWGIKSHHCHTSQRQRRARPVGLFLIARRCFNSGVESLCKQLYHPSFHCPQDVRYVWIWGCFFASDFWFCGYALLVFWPLCGLCILFSSTSLKCPLGMITPLSYADARAG